MEDKKVYQMADLCKLIGVHRNTITRKTRHHLFLWNGKKRKRYYTASEVEFIRDLFIKQ